MRATVRAMRVTRVMRVMRATVQMLRILICFIYIRVRKFWTNFFLCFFFFFFFLFFFFRFCYNFGENFAYSKSPKMRKKIKTLRKNLLRFKTSEKKSEKNIRLHRYSHRYLLIHVIHWYPRGTSFKKKKAKEQHCSISVCWRQEWWVNRAILTGLVFSRESELSALCRLADCCMWLSFPVDKSFFKTRH